MGAAIVIGLGFLALIAIGGGKNKSTPSGQPDAEPLSPSEDPFETDLGTVVRDRWVGPWRLIVYQAGDTFGYIAVTNMAALDEGIEDRELAGDGFSTLSAAENAGVTEVSRATDVRTEDGLVLFPLQEFQRDNGAFYRSFMAKSGGTTGLLATERVADPQSATGTMTRYSLYDRQGWPSTPALEGSSDTDAKMFATVKDFLRSV